MLAILADMKSGDVGTFDIPVPELRAGGVLVRTAFSAISAGTERTTIETGKKSLFGKALARPDLVKQVVEFAKVNGAKAAYQKVQSRLDAVTPLGYSCSGSVLAVGPGITEFRPGDRVACGGQGYASHSEVNFVPRNLIVRVPDSVPLDAACLTTIGAIAIQGLRQSEVFFGETVVVIGAGLVGILTIQLARAAGCRVIAVDANPLRAKQAMEFGASLALTASDPAVHHQITDFTKHGADAAIVTAGSSSVEPVELAAKVLRDRGRIVIVGAVPLGVSRDVMFKKELSLVLSRSYGPGRYDPNYEELGNDYPVGYVRWTEQRNMEAFLEYLSTGAIDLGPLLKLRYNIDQGVKAYSDIQRSGAYTAILDYHSAQPKVGRANVKAHESKSKSERLRIGCIGAGSFARSVIFPHLRALNDAELEAVATASGASALSAQKAFHFQHAWGVAELLSASSIDAVFVLSHHDSHASYVVSALSKNKPLFVEKPLATTSEQLDSVQQAYQECLDSGRSPFVMVGFNRRFSPAADKIREFFVGRREPMVVHVRVNAGHLPGEHWTQQNHNGGRIIGEVCHFLDWTRSIVGSRIVSIFATGIPDGARYHQDNVAIVISFADGSIGNILYLANGDKALPKEFYEVFCEGAVARLNDYQTLEFIKNRRRETHKCNRDKGHRKELELTIAAMREHRPAPIPFEELVEVTKASFAVLDSLNHGLPVRLEEPQSPHPATNNIDAGIVEVGEPQEQH
jgi:predicted dehydrogenase/threonine dehydrogenase-like Zn-dependent dehydrogenase